MVPATSDDNQHRAEDGLMDFANPWRIIDLSLPVKEGMFSGIPGHLDVSFSETKTYDRDRFSATGLTMSVHAGTHMDYPSHLARDGSRICPDAAFPDSASSDALFPELTLTAAYMLDFMGRRSGERITREEVGRALSLFTTAHPLDRGIVWGVLIRTGWNDRWFEPDFRAEPGPCLDIDAARLLMDEGARYIGSDFTCSFGPGEVHDVVLLHPDGNRVLLEGLCNLGEIRSQVVQLLLAPLKLVGREAAPARIYAVEES
jgi:kynurenine formamidase